MSDIWTRFGGTKFALSLLTLIGVGLLVWWGRAPAELIPICLGIYVTGRAVSDIGQRKASTAPPTAPARPADSEAP